MLEANGVAYEYREYTRDPLDASEIRELLGKLGVVAGKVLRRRDRAFKTLGLSGDEPDEVLIEHIARHPTLLERPIGVVGTRAVVGRPPEKLLGLATTGSAEAG